MAVFPMGGGAKEDLRQRCGLSLRLKLDRTGQYDVIDGPRMAELAAEAPSPITFATETGMIRQLGTSVDAAVLIWGDLNNTPEGTKLRLKILDLRQRNATAQQFEKLIRQPTDLRFAVEEVLETLPAIKPFEHPTEEAVQRDLEAEEAWATNPNLAPNPDFSAEGHWEGIYQSERYPIKISRQPPATDKVVIWRTAGENATPTPAQPNNVLAMNLSKQCAENNGLACLSDPIRIEANTRYRFSFRYKSDGPKLHVFVKGYTMAPDITGKPVEREIYRRQVPPTDKTDGQWVTITDELNPQHVAFPVQYLRIDLYAYLHPGTVLFDDIVLKSVGAMTRRAKDEAIKNPVTRPLGAPQPNKTADEHR